MTHLETKRLTLKPYQMEQAERVRELAGNPAVAQTTFVPEPYTLDMAKEWIRSHQEWIDKGEAYPLAITKKDGELLGTMTLRVDKQHQKGELVYWIGKPYWGHGYATEAAKRMITFGIKDLALNRIHASTLGMNPASSRVLQKAGMTLEGTLKEELFHRGEFHDIHMYGLVKEDYSRET